MDYSFIIGAPVHNRVGSPEMGTLDYPRFSKCVWTGLKHLPDIKLQKRAEPVKQKLWSQDFISINFIK